MYNNCCNLKDNYTYTEDYKLKCMNEYGYGLICKDYKVEFPPQHQDVQPGMEHLMHPRPIFNNPYYRRAGKLMNKVAIITGGDSGLGRAVAVGFAKEGACVVIPYYNEHKDAEETKQFIESLGRHLCANGWRYKRYGFLR